MLYYHFSLAEVTRKESLRFKFQFCVMYANLLDNTYIGNMILYGFSIKILKCVCDPLMRALLEVFHTHLSILSTVPLL